MSETAKGFDRLLRSRRVLICVGSGGVGKTTVASALAVRARQLGLKCLVLTVDPAKRLASALGLVGPHVGGVTEEQLVPHTTKDSNSALRSQSTSRHSAAGLVNADLDMSLAKTAALKNKSAQPLKNAPAGELYAAMIDSRAIFDAFVRKHGEKSSVIESILNNPLYQQLSTTLSGSQEFTSMERLLQAVEKDYDLVVLDTPPSQHALDFLRAPEKLNALFQDGITKWLLPGREAQGFFSQLLNRGTMTVFKSLELVTGKVFMEQLIAFFAAIRGLQHILRDRTLAAGQLLKSDQCHFVLVTSFDEAKLVEGAQLKSELHAMGYKLDGVVINRAFPEAIELNESNEDPAVPKLNLAYRDFLQYHKKRYELYSEFSKKLSDDIEIVRVPEYARDINGIEDLESLAVLLAVDQTHFKREKTGAQ
jgi:anion-transporting  ArsA/GET3 family ATPase